LAPPLGRLGSRPRPLIKNINEDLFHKIYIRP